MSVQQRLFLLDVRFWLHVSVTLVSLKTVTSVYIPKDWEEHVFNSATVWESVRSFWFNPGFYCVISVQTT